MIRVLMVDDEPLVRRGIVAGVDWAALGCEVVGEAQSGEEGLALARKLKPELIITDIRMPKMDGITMMNLLREEGCAAHCIVLTAHSDFEYARGALLFGADDYLLKPYASPKCRRRMLSTLNMPRCSPGLPDTPKPSGPSCGFSMPHPLSCTKSRRSSASRSAQILM